MNNLFALFCTLFVHIGSLFSGSIRTTENQELNTVGDQTLRPRSRATVSAQLSATKANRVVVLGSGVGGLTAALYLSRAGLNPLVVEGKMPGGLLTLSHTVQNWPGEMEIDGRALTQKIRDQVQKNGAVFIKENVIHVDFSNHPFVVETRALNGKGKIHKITADAVVVAMGTEPNLLNIPGEEKYFGKGVTNCAICDGALYRDQVVGVVGGGDAAVLEALYLSNLAKEVHVFVRKEELKANEKKRIELLQTKRNVIFHYNTDVVEVKGDEKGLTGVVLKTKGEESHEFPLNGLFLAIGSRPNTELFKQTLDLDERGYILLKNDQETSIPGVYAVGDIVDPIYKQAITAAGEGAIAGLQAESYLMHVTPEVKTESKSEKQAQTEPAPSQEDSNLEASNPIQNETLSLAFNQKNKSGAIEITSRDQFQQEIQSVTSPIVVDFYAIWCGPCKQISPLVDSNAKRLSGKTKFLKVDVDKMSDLARTYNIRAMPTVLLIDPTGNELQRSVGTEQITEFLKNLK